MGLEFRRLIAECSFNAFAKLEFRACQGTFEIRKAFPPEILELRDKRLELFDA